VINDVFGTTETALGELQSQKNRQGRQDRQEEERLETSGLSSSLLFFLAHLVVQKIDFAILL